MNDLDRHTERLCSSCISISSAHAPLPEGAAHKPWLRGRSKQWEIRHHSTNYTRKTPGSITVLGYVLYQKKKRHFATRSTWIILLCSWLWNGMGWGKLKMCNVRWINISQMTGQNLQPTADKTKRNTQNPNTVYEYTMLTTDAWIPFLKHRRTDRNNFHWYDINSHRGAEPFFKS